MTGWGWVALGSQDTIKSPTCDGAPISSDSPCLGATVWNSATALCVNGYVPALPAIPLGSDYDKNWGIEVAINASVLPGGGLGTSFRTITVLLSGSPATGLRLLVHRANDSPAVSYCANVVPGVAVQLTSLNTACWDYSGNTLAMADVPNIDWIGVMVPSSSVAIAVNNLCLTGILFGT